MIEQIFGIAVLGRAEHFLRGFGAGRPTLRGQLQEKGVLFHELLGDSLNKGLHLIVEYVLCREPGPFRGLLLLNGGPCHNMTVSERVLP